MEASTIANMFPKKPARTAKSDGKPMKQVRMLRVREVLASGDLRPREREVEKRVLLAERPKRKELAGGLTRPWHVDELNEER